jgi:hypothetical protein
MSSESLMYAHYMFQPTNQHWSLSGDTKIADEAAVLPSVSSIFGVCLIYVPMCL